jgi:uncharacterized oligopeptide transporter (OPT) family protein
VLALGNVYLGLKTGFGDTGNVTAAVLGFAFFRALRSSYSPLENNVTQIVASSAAGMAFTSGVVTAFPALRLLEVAFPLWAVLPWSVALGVAGVLLGAALHGPLLERERLAFPTGKATGEVISALHAPGGARAGAARPLGVGAVLAAVWTWFRDGVPAWIPSVSLGAAMSPVLLGTGMLIGPRAAASLLAGGLLAHRVLAPALEGDAEVSLLWPAGGLLLGAALVAVLKQATAVGRGLRDLRALGTSLPRRELVLGGLVLMTVIVLARVIFDVPLLAALGVSAVALVLATVCARGAGETDVAPFTQMGQLTQAGVSALPKTSVMTPLLSGSMVTGVSVSTAQTLWSLRTGQTLGASVRPQLLAQLAGVLLGAVVSVVAFHLFASAYGLGSDALPAPYAVSWRAVAELSQDGSTAISNASLQAGLIALGVGLLLALAESWSWGARVLPSPYALSMGFLVPGPFGVTIALGALVALALRRWRGAEARESELGSGLIAGEAVVAVVVAVARVLSPG